MILTGSLRRQAAILVAIGLTLAGIAAAVALVTVVQTHDASRRALLAANIDTASNEYLITMVDQESGLRGYLLTGSTTFLEPYQMGRADAANLEREVSAMITEPSARADYSRVQTAAHAWQAFAENQLALRGSGAASGTDLQASQEGKGLFDAFRSEQQTFDKSNEQRLTAAVSEFQARADSQPLVFGALAATGLGILGALTILVFRLILAPISQLTRASTDLAEGRPADIPALARRDEVGRLARALATWKETSDNPARIAAAMTEVGGLVDTNEILQAGLTRLAEVVDAAEVVVTLYHGTEGVITDSLSGTVPGSTVGPTSVRERVLASGTTVRTNVNEVLDQLAPELRAVMGKYGPLMSVPMITRGVVSGLVSCLRVAEHSPFSDYDAQRAEIMVPYLGAALTVARQFVELREASTAKSNFLAVMSHELRTPMNSILGFSQILNTEESGPLNERQHRYVSNIENSGRRLLELINDVLDLSKVEAGRMEFDLETFELAPILLDCSAEVAPLAAVKSLQMRSKLLNGVLVRADRRRLRQVLLNLLSNAVKFTPEGGSVQVTITAEDRTVSVSVKDTGVGIPLKQQPRIFEEFMQAESGLMREHDGTGLGLALSRRLMEGMTGDMGFDSTEGVGSTFTISLPRAHPTGAKGTRGTVLVVEDERKNRELLEVMLSEAGFRAESAINAQEGMRAAKGWSPGAILLDILLNNGVDGWDLLDQLKADETTKGIPVIAVTVLDSIPAERRAQLHGFFTKPIDRESLIRTIENITPGGSSGR